MSKQIERRTITSEFRAESLNQNAPVIEGYAAKFATQSEDMGGWVETLAPTAFDASIAATPDIRALFNHDPNLILGRTSAGTLKVTKDDTGLFYSIVPPDTQTARDLIASMKRGDITQSSFAMRVNDASWAYDEVTGMDVRTVKQAELFDVSPVTYPAYTSATSGVRSLPEDMPMEIRSRIEQRATKTKRVDGEDLPASSFLIVLDPEKTDTWNLPWKFSTTEKTKSHLRDALARFDQIEGVDAATKSSAYKKLLALCKKYGIDVSAEKNSQSSVVDGAVDQIIDDQDICNCICPACVSEDCTGCTDPNCQDEECDCAYSSANRSDLNRLHIRLAIAQRRMK